MTLAIDGRTTRHAGYQISQQKRKRIEEVFGWLKTVGMLRKTRHRGVFKVAWVFTFAVTAYMRIPGQGENDSWVNVKSIPGRRRTPIPG